MLSYWILRDRNDSPIGLVKKENDSVSLQLNGSCEAEWMLFSDIDAVPLAPDGTAVLSDANAVLGMSDGRIVGFAAGPGAQTAAVYRMRMSQNYTIEPQAPQPSESQVPTEQDLKDRGEQTTAQEPLPSMEPDATEAQTPSMELDATDAQTPLTEPEGEEPPDHPDVSASNTEIESVTDSAERTAQFSLLLSRADAFFMQFEPAAVASANTLVQKEDNHVQGGIDLFPQAFPNARWRYVDGRNILPHYEGYLIGKNGERTHILAVRGRAAPRPPRALFGFTRYLIGSDGNGYWIRTE